MKERLDLSPRLRDLDKRIEAVELEIRRQVEAAIGADPARWLPHVLQKVDDRIRSAARRNPGLRPEQLTSPGMRLEYCDLRELQDLIQSKPLWSAFERQYATKEGLAVRFGQLAELRNGIRHSRSVDEIARKEGEAAILWFEQVLDRR